MVPVPISGLLLGLRQRAVQHLMEQGRLSRAGDSGNRNQHIERNADLYILEIVGADPSDMDLLRSRFAADDGRLNAQVLGEITPGQGCRIVKNLLIGALGDQLAAVFACSGTEVENAVRRTHDVGIVLDDEDRISEVAQILQNLDQAVGVARMQTDRWFVENIERTHESRPERSCQLNALRLTARQRRRKPVERQIFQANVIHKTQALANLLQ